MSLLQALKLPPAPIKPQPILGITDSQGAELTKSGSRPIAVTTKPSATLDARLGAREAMLRDAYAKLSPHQERLEEAIGKAAGDTKKAMEAQKDDVDRHLATIERQLKQLDADRRALASPGIDAKTMNDIVARNKSDQPIGKAVEVDRHDSELEKKRTENRATTTSTSVQDGKATTRIHDDTTTVGPASAARKLVDSRETVSGHQRTSTSVTRTDEVSKEGFSREKVVRQEREDGDRTSSVEKKEALKLGPDGISSTNERKTTTVDGSSTSASRSTKAERGDGNLGVSRTTSRTATNADGSSNTGGTSAKGGLRVDKDGAIGAGGEGQRTMEHTTAGGLQTGAVVGLLANISCNIKAAGGTPPQYDLVVSINLGANVSASAGRGGEEGSDRKASVKVSGSAAVFMNTSHRLGEQAAKAYVESLKAASSGQGNASGPEFKIIRTGLSNGWNAARDLYLGLSAKTGSASDVDAMQAHDSKEIGKKTSGGASASVDAKGVGVEIGAEKSHDQSMKVTKEEDGSATYETKVGDGTSTTHGAKVSVGVAEGGLSLSKSVTTTAGYKLSVKPGMKNARALQDQIAKLSSQAEIDAFAKAHPETVVERTGVHGEADKTAVSVGVAGVKGNLDFSHGVEESKTTDASGKVIGTQTKGSNTGGAGVALGKIKVSDSTSEEAVAKTDADGQTTLDVSKTRTSTDTAKLLGTLPLVGDKKKGALATVTGGGVEEDTDTRDVQGITLGAKDLDWLASVAGHDMNAWMKACDYDKMRDDWRAAANEVRKAGGGRDAVAKALARFVGKDTDRAKVINHIVRPAGDTSSGARFEYPQSIAGRRPEYEALILKESQSLVAAAAKGGDVAKAQQVGKDLLARLQSLFNGVNSASDFVEPAVKEEMLSAIGKRQSRVELAVRALSGDHDAAGAAKAQDQADYQRLLDLCIRHQQSQNECFDRIEAEYHKRWSKEDAVVIATLIKQIRDLHGLWTKDYDAMAALAQENDWGKDTYWKYKPDRERFDRAVKGHPGEPSKAQRETADKRRKPAPEFTEGELAKANRDESSITYKRYLQMSGDLRNECSTVKGLGDRLLEALNKQPNAAAQKAMKEAGLDFEDAQALLQKVKPNDMPSMWEFGAPALDLLRKAHAGLSKVEKMLSK